MVAMAHITSQSQTVGIALTVGEENLKFRLYCGGKKHVRIRGQSAKYGKKKTFHANENIHIALFSLPFGHAAE